MGWWYGGEGPKQLLDRFPGVCLHHTKERPASRTTGGERTVLPPRGEEGKREGGKEGKREGIEEDVRTEDVRTYIRNTYMQTDIHKDTHIHKNTRTYIHTDIQK